MDPKKLVLNDSNPRQISDSRFKQLADSLQQFPQMLVARPIVVDEDMVVIGGNMRLRALLSLGAESVPVHVAEGWTEEEKQQFIIKDNVGFGDWDWDVLANEWDNVNLEAWGLDVWQPEKDVDYSALEEVDEVDVGSLEDGVRKAVCIDFTLEEHSEAQAIVAELRSQGADVGALVLGKLKELRG